MMLECVTFTGADSRNDVGEVLDFMQKYPMAEFGILVGSATGFLDGTARFPSLDWIKSLLSQSMERGGKWKFSLHVCDHWLRRAFAGGWCADDLGPFRSQFARVQLNTHGADTSVKSYVNAVDGLLRGDDKWLPRIIFQFDNWDNIGRCYAVSRLRRESFFAGLWDSSSGAGVLPSLWPVPEPWCYNGYAGGLGPGNVLDEIVKIDAAMNRLRMLGLGENSHPYWIDMETKVCGPRGLDLGKCADVCEKIDRWKKGAV